MSRENNMIWKTLIISQKMVMIITGILVMVIVALAMALRYFFNLDLRGYEEYLSMIAFWLYMIGSSYGSYDKSQITADILNVMMKPGKLKTILNLVKSGLTLILAGVFCYWAFEYALWGIVMHTITPVLHIPMAIGQSSIFVGLLLVTFYNTVYFYDEILEAKSFFRSEKLKEKEDHK